MYDREYQRMYAKTPKGRERHRLARSRYAVNHPDRVRANREIQQTRSRIEYPKKYVARYTVANALQDGRLTRGVCEVCSDPRTEAHHDDYSKPLDVRWLCKKHHEEHHHAPTNGQEST